MGKGSRRWTARIAASFGAAALAEPINTPARKYDRAEHGAAAGD